MSPFFQVMRAVWIAAAREPTTGRGWMRLYLVGVWFVTLLWSSTHWGQGVGDQFARAVCLWTLGVGAVAVGGVVIFAGVLRLWCKSDRYSSRFYRRF